MTNTTTKSIIAQLKIATANPVALIIGGLVGALVPIGTNHIAHNLLGGVIFQWSVYTAMVLGGLVFSCLSVYSFSRVVTGRWYKALALVVAIEGYMTFTNDWLSTTALVFLIAINIIANGCRVAVERQQELAAERAAQTVVVPPASPEPALSNKLVTALESLSERIAKLEAAPVQAAPAEVPAQPSKPVRAKKSATKRTKKQSAQADQLN